MFRIPRSLKGALKISEVVEVPEAQLVDGLAIVNQPCGCLMSGDAETGTLYLIHIEKHTADTILEDELLNGKAQDDAAGLAHIGINDLIFLNGNLYFTNTAKDLHGYVPVGHATGKSSAEPSILELPRELCL
ncbi:MAG: hypothetical protein ALECFALPRED_008546 [Alectoria fallacina]|uniref:Uncharacterized protein n=1 Tax=Alectoria fallacina TaxID=1903189 RepID=A0A8H3EH09_9LECA|nr:MAG: hypothetical protein ALECFALPRED_008546 [Alectoria fallacina]